MLLEARRLLLNSRPIVSNALHSMRFLRLFILLFYLPLSVNAQVRIVSVTDDGSLFTHQVNSPELADWLTFKTEGKINKNSFKNLVQVVRFATGSRAEIYEPVSRGFQNGIPSNIKTGTWKPVEGGYEAIVKDKTGKEYKLYLNINHNCAYYSLFNPNAEADFRGNKILKSQPVIGMAFYRQTPYDYEGSNMYIANDGLDVPIKSLPELEYKQIVSDSGFTSKIFRKDIPEAVSDEKQNDQPNAKDTKSRYFEMSLYGIRDSYNIGYNYSNYDLSPIIKQFREKKKGCEMILYIHMDPDLGFSSEISKRLSIKLDSIRHTIDTRDAIYKRFLVTAKMDTIDNVQIDSNTVRFKGRLKLYVIDSFSKKTFSRYYLPLEGEGTNCEEAILSSLSILDTPNHYVIRFMRSGLKGIDEHYSSLLSKDLQTIVADFIPSRLIGHADSEEMESRIEKAIEFLLSTPSDHNKYEESLNFAAFLSYIKSEYHYCGVLRDASRLVGWRQNSAQNKKYNNQAITMLSKIPAQSAFYKEAREEIAEAKRNLRSANEELQDLMREGVEAHTNMIDPKTRDEMKKVKRIEGNTGSGIFTLGVLMAAFAIAAPAAAPAAPIILLII